MKNAAEFLCDSPLDVITFSSRFLSSRKIYGLNNNLETSHPKNIFAIYLFNQTALRLKKYCNLSVEGKGHIFPRTNKKSNPRSFCFYCRRSPKFKKNTRFQYRQGRFKPRQDNGRIHHQFTPNALNLSPEEGENPRRCQSSDLSLQNQWSHSNESVGSIDIRHQRGTLGTNLYPLPSGQHLALLEKGQTFFRHSDVFGCVHQLRPKVVVKSKQTAARDNFDSPTTGSPHHRCLWFQQMCSSQENMLSSNLKN